MKTGFFYRKPAGCHFATAVSLVVPEKFQHILGVLNTNINECHKIAFASTAIKGVG